MALKGLGYSLTSQPIYCYSEVVWEVQVVQKAGENKATVSVTLLIFNTITAEDIHRVMWETALYTLLEETVAAARASEPRDQT